MSKLLHEMQAKTKSVIKRQEEDGVHLKNIQQEKHEKQAKGIIEIIPSILDASAEEGKNSASVMDLYAATHINHVLIKFSLTDPKINPAELLKGLKGTAKIVASWLIKEGFMVYVQEYRSNAVGPHPDGYLIAEWPLEDDPEEGAKQCKD